MMSRSLPLLFAGALAMAACKQSPPPPEAPDASAQEAPGGPGITQEALDTNLTISRLGVLARSVADDPATAPEALGEIEQILSKGENLPAALKPTLEADLDALRQAAQRDDEGALGRAAGTMIAHLREAAPAGEAQQ